MIVACLFWFWCASAPAATGNSPAAPSPAEQKIAAARRVIAGGHASAQIYNDLALALARRARETGDPGCYDQANEALAQCFKLAPDNLDGQKTRTWILLGKHEFTQALREAKALNKRVPDDLTVYALLVDAHVELGNYAEAETAAQWLLDLRPGNVLGLTRAAYLRELFGDVEGALELMRQAYERTPPAETEDRAWLLTQLAHLHRLSGRLQKADALLTEALRLFPAYHYALAELARVRTAQKKYGDAVSLLQQRYAAAAHPENLYALAEALERAGKKREARKAFLDFEKQARAESSGADNANRELIFYYTDHANDPRAALKLAEQEIARRQDVYTRDAYAWALRANKRMSEARQQIEKALAVGTRDPLLLEHARRLGINRPTAAVSN